MVFSATGGALSLLPQDRGARGVVISLGTTGVDELKTLAVLQGALHDQVTSDRVILETFEDLTREEIQVKVTVVRGVASKIGAAKINLTDTPSVTLGVGICKNKRS